MLSVDLMKIIEVCTPLVADSRFAALELLAALPDKLNSLTRRLEAAYSKPASIR